MDACGFVGSCVVGVLLASTAAAAPQDGEADLLAKMTTLLKAPPAVCKPLNAAYHPAYELEQAGGVSTIFKIELGALAKLRRDKHCPKLGRRHQQEDSPIKRATLIKNHDALMVELKACKAASCAELEEALKIDFFTIAGVLPADDAELPRIINDVAVTVTVDGLVQELIRKIRSGELDAKRVNDQTMKHLFAAVLNLAQQRGLSKANLDALIDELRAIVSDQDLIHLGEALQLRRGLRTKDDWARLGASVAILLDVYPELKAKAPKLPESTPDDAGLERFAASLAAIFSNAQLVELNRLQFASVGIPVAPEKVRPSRLLVVSRQAPACAGDRGMPACKASRAMLLGFLVALGTNFGGAQPVEAQGTADELLNKSEALMQSPVERSSCDPARWGALCEYPYAGVVAISTEVSGDKASAHASWRTRNEPNGLLRGSAGTDEAKEVAMAYAAGSSLGVETLREGVLWKFLRKEVPVSTKEKEPVQITQLQTVAGSTPVWHRWVGVGLVIATAASFMGAAYTHNTSAGSTADDRLLQVGFGSLAALAGLETWDLARAP